MKPCAFASFAKITLILALATLSVRINAQTPSTTFRPALVEIFAASYSYSGKSGYKHGTTTGETSVWHIDASASGRSFLGANTILGYGAAFALNTVDSDANVPTPERLGELSLNVGVTQIFSQQWTASIYARPGYYGDMESYTANTLNVPALALASYTPNQSITWMFGMSVNPFAEYVVMPVLSVRWSFAKDWSLNVGFPRVGVSWQASESLELGVFGTMQGGGYRTTKAPNHTTRTDLSDTYVNYREIRVGARAAYKFTKKISLALEGGWMADRRFDYYDRDYELKGKSSAYGTIALDVKL